MAKLKKPKTLTHDEVAALAESVGLPGEAFAQIAKGESGYQVGATGHDPGGTIGLGLWQITTKYNDDIIKRFGGMQRLLTDPLANARAAKAIYDRQGIKAWYGTKYLTDPTAHYKGTAQPPAGATKSAPMVAPVQAPYGQQQATPAVNNAPLRRELVGQFLQQGGVANPNAVLTLAGSYGQAADVPAITAPAASSYAQPQPQGQPSTKTPKLKTPTGVADFEGSEVAAWIAPALTYARKHGWKGHVNSGFRSLEDQTRIYNSGVRPAAKPGTSNHEGADYPRGAVDVSDAETLSRIIAASPYAKKLQWAGAKDPVHFSHPHNGSY